MKENDQYIRSIVIILESVPYPIVQVCVARAKKPIHDQVAGE